MAISKVSFGDKPLIDLTGDTVEPNVVLDGYTFHGANGELQTGNLVPSEGREDRYWVDYINKRYRLENFVSNNNLNYYQDTIYLPRIYMDNKTLYNIIKDNNITICDNILRFIAVYTPEANIHGDYYSYLVNYDVFNPWHSIHLIEGVRSCRFAYGDSKWYMYNSRLNWYFSNINNTIVFADSMEHCDGFFAFQNNVDLGYLKNVKFDVYLNKNLKTASYLFYSDTTYNQYNAVLNSIVIGENLESLSHAFDNATFNYENLSFITEGVSTEPKLDLSYMFYKRGNHLSQNSTNNLYEMMNGRAYNICGLFMYSGPGNYRLRSNNSEDMISLRIPEGVIDCSFSYSATKLNDVNNIYIPNSVKEAKYMFHNSLVNGSYIGLFFNKQGNINVAKMFENALVNIRYLYNFPALYANSDCYHMFYNAVSNDIPIDVTTFSIGNDNVNASGMFFNSSVLNRFYKGQFFEVEGKESNYDSCFYGALNAECITQIVVNVGDNTKYNYMFYACSGNNFNRSLQIYLNLNLSLVDSYVPSFYHFIGCYGSTRHNGGFLKIYYTSKKQVNLNSFFAFSNVIFNNNFRIYCNNIDNLIGISGIFNNRTLTFTVDTVNKYIYNKSSKIYIYNNLSY